MRWKWKAYLHIVRLRVRVKVCVCVCVREREKQRECAKGDELVEGGGKNPPVNSMKYPTPAVNTKNVK